MSKSPTRALLSAALLISAAAYAVSQQGRTPADLKPALDSITAADIMRHTRKLASDEFEGRGPGTRGEDLSVEYLQSEFRRMGLKPGNPDGTFVQQVPLVGIRTDPQLSFSAGGNKTALKFPEDFVGVSRRDAAQINVTDSDLVFVGYGVSAPEYGWDDYKDVDVRGKTIVMLINDPAVPDPRDASKLDEKMFRGRAMTYYGRWTYKFEIASEKGAAAAIIVHETGPAGYPYEVVKGSWAQENFDIKTGAGAPPRVAVESWLHLDRAKELFKAAGQDFDALKRAAVSKDFKPVALNAKASFAAKNTRREVRSRNVVAKLEGSDPKLKDEYVVYSAHWDHLGKNDALAGDKIYNGAADNASGTAQLLEIAEAYAKLPKAPKRSVLFLAVTAEEKGLLGAKYYATSPLYPLNRTLANINIDGANQWGRTRDVVIIGDGNSTLDDLTREVAAAQGRTVTPDPETEKGFYYRSDHFEFAKVGVPALYPDTGSEYVGKPAGYGQQKRDEYTTRDYHKPSDEVKADWDLSGAAEDAQLLFMVGQRVADGVNFPEWKPGTEFKAKRDAMMKSATR